MSSPLLTIANVNLVYGGTGGLRALNDVSLSVNAGETVALVGESGSGKSTIALSVMGLHGPEAQLTGSIRFDGRELIDLDAASQRALRGRDIGMVFQDPFTSLNPSLRIGEQVSEPLVHNRGVDRATALQRAVEALGEVGLPNPGELISAYPHQLSGGMQQRVLIATAIICNPRLLILDEPTTALDVTVEAQILDLLDRLSRDRGLAMMFITHNLGVVNRIAHRVCVLYAGKIVETGPKDQVLGTPSHPYTKGLLASLPRFSVSGDAKRIAPIPGRFPNLLEPPPGCIFSPRCPFAESACEKEQALVDVGSGHAARCWKSAQLGDWPSSGSYVHERAAPTATTEVLVRTDDLVKIYKRGRLGGGIEWTRKLGVIPWPQVRSEIVHAVDGISLSIGRGEAVGLVGESGSGKSTFGRVLLRLIDPSAGSIEFDKRDIAKVEERELSGLRKKAQIVFQNPDSSLNPRRRVGDAIARAVAVETDVPSVKRRAHVEGLLDRVGLPRSYYDRYPHQLSGGEKQRVGIARALATDPDFIVCDEPVSALDVSVQATVLNLLDDLRRDLNISYLFISHDLSVVSYIADRVAVMYSGRICEVGPTDAVLSPPYHPYTEALLSAVPLPTPGAEKRQRIRLRGDRPPSAAERGGCPFHTRCPRALGKICETVAPPVLEPAPGHRIACHLPLDELMRVPSVLPNAKPAHAAE